MPKNKSNEIIYHVIMYHLHHYQQVKKIFKIDYDSQMIVLVVYAHFIYQTLNPTLKKGGNIGLEWDEMFPAIKGLAKKEKKYKKKLTIFSVSQALDLPKESVRRKVLMLCKKKYLDYSVGDGLSVGDNLEGVAKKMAPEDLFSLGKVIKVVERNGGIEQLFRLVPKK